MIFRWVLERETCAGVLKASLSGQVDQYARKGDLMMNKRVQSDSHTTAHHLEMKVVNFNKLNEFLLDKFRHIFEFMIELLWHNTIIWKSLTANL